MSSLPSPPLPRAGRRLRGQGRAAAALPPQDGGQRPRTALPPVPSTLLIPLAARARGDRCFPWLACGDAVAADLLERMDAPVDAYLGDLPTVLNVLWRTRLLQATARAFFGAHPAATGVNLGCGLSHHFQWLDTGRNRWIDADLPEVTALRRQWLPARCPRTALKDVDISVPGWWQRLGLPQQQLGRREPSGRPRAPAQPVLVLCEGVLMYLEPAQVQAVLREFARCAPPGSRMVLDVLTHRAVGRACGHPSVGPTGAEFRWGAQRLADLAAVHPRLSLHAAHSAAACYGPAALALEALWSPWLGAPLYAMVTLGVE